MNANSNFDILAATQPEEITDAVLNESNLDTIITRMDIKFLHHRTELGFFRLRATSLSSPTRNTIPELFCVSYITNKIYSDSGPKFVLLHKDTQEGMAILVFRTEESKVFGFNEIGLFQHQTRLRAVFGDAFDSFISFDGPVGGLGSLDEMKIVPPAMR